MVLIDQEKVVKVTADLLCGVHGRIEIKLAAFREGRKLARQHVFLNTGSQRKLGAEAFLFRGDGRVLTDIAFQVPVHLFNGMGQRLQFVAGADVGYIFLAAVQLADELVRILLQRLDRADRRPLKNPIVDDNADTGDHDNGKGQHDVQVHLCFPDGGDGHIDPHQGRHLVFHAADGHQCGSKPLSPELAKADKELFFLRHLRTGKRLHHGFLFVGAVWPVLQELCLHVRQVLASGGQIVIDLADVDQIVLRRNHQIEILELVFINARCHERVADVEIFVVLCFRLEELRRRDAADVVGDHVAIGIDIFGIDVQISPVQHLAGNKTDPKDQEDAEKGKVSDASAGNGSLSGFYLFVDFHVSLSALFRPADWPAQSALSFTAAVPPAWQGSPAGRWRTFAF